MRSAASWCSRRMPTTPRLAAFGLYSRAPQVCIVTLTQGEIEAEDYQRLGLDAAQAARLKGRLRSWDSLAVPLWGGVPQKPLRAARLLLPATIGDARRTDGNLCFTRVGRVRYPQRAPPQSAATAGRRRWPAFGGRTCWPTWLLCSNTFARKLSSPRTRSSTRTPIMSPPLWRSIRPCWQSRWQPEIALLYANHLHDNDRWPMGPAGCGIALPPAFASLPADALWSPTLSEAVQLDKAMALAMQHDLQGRLPFKKRLRRRIQQVLAGRSLAPTGENEFFPQSRSPP
jgi:hypothetical protein